MFCFLSGRPRVANCPQVYKHDVASYLNAEHEWRKIGGRGSACSGLERGWYRLCSESRVSDIAIDSNGRSVILFMLCLCAKTQR